MSRCAHVEVSGYVGPLVRCDADGCDESGLSADMLRWWDGDDYCPEHLREVEAMHRRSVVGRCTPYVVRYGDGRQVLAMGIAVAAACADRGGEIVNVFEVEVDDAA